MAGAASLWARRTGQAVLARHSLAGSLGWTLVAVAVPTLLRLVLDAGHYGTPFVSYYPVVVLSALFLGWRYSLLTTVLCAATARLLFMQDFTPLASTVEGLSIFGLFVLSCMFLIAIGEWLRRVLMELESASSRESLLNQELRHRLKNLLAVVNSLSALSHRHSDPEQAQNAFAERLAALDRATGLLGGDNVVSCSLPELAEEALRPFLADYDIRLVGTPHQIDRDGCVPTVLALHELATNAIKYGALSAPGGRVELSWNEPADGQVRLLWEEKGGPPVAQPERRGMGSRILSMHSPAASFAIAYPREGVRCELTLKAV
jgi:two-component sensor histidine kinase